MLNAEGWPDEAKDAAGLVALLALVLTLMLGGLTLESQAQDPARNAAAKRKGLAQGAMAPRGAAQGVLVPQGAAQGAIVPQGAAQGAGAVRPAHVGNVDLAAAGGPAIMLAGRSKHVRPLLVKRDGGNDPSEAAVARGLKWLSLHQAPDGHWSLHAFHRTDECKGRCKDPGMLCDTGATALALLPMLGAGYTHYEGEYAGCIERGLNWLLNHQQLNGGWDEALPTKNYSHAQATIVLCEAFAMTHDPKLWEPAVRAITYVVATQDEEDGGWPYVEDTDSDTSVTGWELMALRAGRAAGIEVPLKVFTSAGVFLTLVQPDPRRGLFSYLEGMPISDSMTAEGLLSRQYSGWKTDNPALQFGVSYLLSPENLPNKKKFNLYYWYYATQVLHHVGGQAWATWNPKVRELLVELQEKEGHQAGSWKPTGYHDVSGGRLYMTALATCTLEVYYRYLPLYSYGDGYSMPGQNPGQFNPAMQNPAAFQQQPGGMNPGIFFGPGQQNPGFYGPGMQYPNLPGQGLQNPGLQNPNLQNPNLQNPGFIDPDM